MDTRTHTHTCLELGNFDSSQSSTKRENYILVASSGVEVLKGCIAGVSADLGCVVCPDMSLLLLSKSS